MASLTRGVSFRRQGSSGKSWADSLMLGGEQQAPQRFNNSRQGKSDGITKKSIMTPDDHPGNSSPSQMKNRSSTPSTGGQKPCRNGVFGWLKSRFRKTRS